MKNLKGALTCMSAMNIKPNYSALAREYGKDRRTITKYYNGYEGRPKTINKPSKLDKYEDIIKLKLEIPGVNIKAVFMYLKEIDENIGTYSNFQKYVRKKGLKTVKDNTVHLRFETEYGKQLQFDWKGPMTFHNRKGDKIVLYVFSATLCTSRFHVLLPSLTMTREDVINCLIKTFNILGGIPEELLTDNMSSIISKDYKNFVPEFLQFCSDIGVNAKRCKIRHCETKGKVESSNRFANWLLPYENNFEDYEELCSILERKNNQANLEVNETTNMTPVSLLQIEKEYLRQLPNKKILDSYLENCIVTKVSNGLLVNYKCHQYSVPAEFINKTVKLKEIDNKLHIYYNNNLITTHDISNQTINYKLEHYKEGLKKTMPYLENDEIEKMAISNLKEFEKFTK